MENGRTNRWIWIVILVLVLALAGLWLWQQQRGERLTARHAEALERQRQELSARAETWAGAVADRGADALFRAFAAGVQPAVLSGRSEALLQAKNALLQVPDVTFVHVLTPDGQVLMSSDDKLTATGQVGDQAAWALAARELTRRDGGVAGAVELVGPIRSGTDVAAVLWMGVSRGRMVADTEPQ
ncbi:MAG: hypothetical protein ACRD2Z_12610 [Thermoanaerobaculia bacterium]